MSPTSYRTALPRDDIILKQLGDVLLSQGENPQLPSALRSLTSVFGMGTGVTFSLSSPNYFILKVCSLKTR
jgi:hypothetical protein